MCVTGKFLLLRNENFYEHLIALGIPEERARAVDTIRPILEISINGRKLVFNSYSDNFHYKSELILEEEVDETIAVEYNIKSIARRVGQHAIEIESTGIKTERGIRRYQFSDKDLVMTIENDNKNIPVAKRYYSRLQE